MSLKSPLKMAGLVVLAMIVFGTQSALAQGNAVTDSWITMKVHAQFVPEKALSGSDINVDTNQGTVTLRGTVASEGGRQRAVAIAKATDGVKGVTDQLTIATPPAGKTTDGWIKSKIYGQLVTEKSLANSDINVDVNDGAVTLKGTVHTEAARLRAVAIAKATEGVKSVKDTMTVKQTDNE
jgi:hyperosmotically inducible periplasmic protein